MVETTISNYKNISKAVYTSEDIKQDLGHNLIINDAVKECSEYIHAIFGALKSAGL